MTRLVQSRSPSRSSQELVHERLRCWHMRFPGELGGLSVDSTAVCLACLRSVGQNLAAFTHAQYLRSVEYLSEVQSSYSWVQIGCQCLGADQIIHYLQCP
eukprot:992870-Pyramimonas_sp.AAC.1